MPDRLQDNSKAHWVSKLTNLENASAVELMMDAVISEPGNANFSDITTGGADDLYGIPDSTNHLSRRKGVATTGYEPSGGDILFGDGHVEWRHWADMAYKYNDSEGEKWFYW